jgi:hypothetical protein
MENFICVCTGAYARLQALYRDTSDAQQGVFAWRRRFRGVCGCGLLTARRDGILWPEQLPGTARLLPAAAA